VAKLGQTNHNIIPCRAKAWYNIEDTQPQLLYNAHVVMIRGYVYVRGKLTTLGESRHVL